MEILKNTLIYFQEKNEIKWELIRGLVRPFLKWDESGGRLYSRNQASTDGLSPIFSLVCLRPHLIILIVHCPNPSMSWACGGPSFLLSTSHKLSWTVVRFRSWRGRTMGLRPWRPARNRTKTQIWLQISDSKWEVNWFGGGVAVVVNADQGGFRGSIWCSSSMCWCSYQLQYCAHYCLVCQTLARTVSIQICNKSAKI